MDRKVVGNGKSAMKKAQAKTAPKKAKRAKKVLKAK